MQFGVKIRVIRESMGLRQDFINDKLGWYSGRLARIESGKQEIMASELLMVANVLGVPIGDFYLSSSIASSDSEQCKGA